MMTIVETTTISLHSFGISTEKKRKHRSRVAALSVFMVVKARVLQRQLDSSSKAAPWKGVKKNTTSVVLDALGAGDRDLPGGPRRPPPCGEHRKGVGSSEHRSKRHARVPVKEIWHRVHHEGAHHQRTQEHATESQNQPWNKKMSGWKIFASGIITGKMPRSGALTEIALKSMYVKPSSVQSVSNQPNPTPAMSTETVSGVWRRDKHH